MDMHKFSLTSAFVLSVFSFSLATDASAQGRYLSVSAQRSAIVECQYDMGIRSRPKLQVTYVDSPFGGPSTVKLLPSGSVDAQTAKVINSCADAKLGRGNGEVVKVVRVVKKKRCVSVMVGGDGYCLKAK
ncbi:MAG: hypothetical protein AAFV74_08640 [Pseudomonadota bacterium]